MYIILIKRACTIIQDVNPKDENGILNAFERSRTQLMKVNREKTGGELATKYEVLVKVYVYRRNTKKC